MINKFKKENYAYVHIFNCLLYYPLGNTTISFNEIWLKAAPKLLRSQVFYLFWLKTFVYDFIANRVKKKAWSSINK
jgi:hypothetical protein